MKSRFTADLRNRPKIAAAALAASVVVFAAYWVGLITYRSGPAKEGTVVDQSVQRDSPVPPGTAIDLVISGKPPRRTRVPGVKDD